VITIDSGVAFDFPETWELFTERGRCVFHTPRREEIVLSAWVIVPPGASTERGQYSDAVFENGLEAARRGIAEPALQVIKPLAEDSDGCAFRCWTVIAQTHARDTLFAEAVIRHPRGTIFLTYEAPFVDGAESAFRDLLRMFHQS
jgi:hypothetical protein